MNVSELKKLETTGYSSKLDEIAKNDTEVFLKVKLSGRRTFGEDEFEPKNVFAVDFGNHMNVLDLDKCDVYQLDQPQLNENQQIVLSWLKIEHFDSYFKIEHFDSYFKATVSNLFFYVRHDDIEGFPNLNYRKLVEGYKQLSDKEFAQVLEVFSRWAQEREEE